MEIERFLSPQDEAYPEAIAEIRAGCKTGHWMWYIFPQFRGLGHSNTAWYYGIESLEEARQYLAHPVLGGRLREITQVLLTLPERDPVRIFGWTDSLKLRSCMTLFARAGQEEIFSRVLEKYYHGGQDALTLELLSRQERRDI